MAISLFKQNRYKKYIYLFLYPVYLLVGLLRVFRILPKKYYIYGAGSGFAFIDNTKYSFLENINNSNCVWICHSNEILKQIIDLGIFRVANSKSFRGLYYQIMAKMVIISHGTFDVLPPLLLGTKVFQYWHGIPIKKIGKHVPQEKQYPIITKIWKIIYSVYPHLNNYYCDIFVDGSKNGYYINFQPYKPKIIKMSYPRWKNISRENKINTYFENEQLRYLKKIKTTGRKIIIYLPTYREKEKSQKDLENNLIKLADLFIADERLFFVYKSHFIISERCKKNNIFMNYKNPDPYPLLELSSGLITDYSSISIDYLLLNKPVQFFIFDRRTYEKHPGCYFDLNKLYGDLISVDAEDVYIKLRREIFKESDYSDIRNKMLNKLIDVKAVDFKIYDIERIYQYLYNCSD